MSRYIVWLTNTKFLIPPVVVVRFDSAVVKFAVALQPRVTINCQAE
jgi:hypothetical protein